MDASSEDYSKLDERQLAMKELARQPEEEGFGVFPFDLIKVIFSLLKINNSGRMGYQCLYLQSTYDGTSSRRNQQLSAALRPS